MPPLPPIFVPGMGLMPVPQALELLAPPLAPEEGIYLNQLLELTAALTGLSQSDLDNPPPSRVIELLTSPTAQLTELRLALTAVASGQTPAEAAQRPANQEVSANAIHQLSELARLTHQPDVTLHSSQVISEISTTVLDQLAAGQAKRAGVPIATLFPLLPRMKQMLARQ